MRSVTLERIFKNTKNSIDEGINPLYNPIHTQIASNTKTKHYISYQERRRDRPDEARQPAGSDCKGANSYRFQTNLEDKGRSMLI